MNVTGAAGDAAERSEAELTLEKLSGGVLAGLREEEGLASFAECKRERIFSDEVRVFDGDMRMVFVRSGFISGGFGSRLDDYDRSINVV